MSTAVIERPTTSKLAREVADLRRRLSAVEEEVREIRDRDDVAADQALRNLRQSWAAMSPEDQDEATRVFDAVERESRALRVDG